MAHDKPQTMPAFILALGIAVAAFIVGEALTNMRMVGRSVSVKGLVEREVVADKALWTLKTKVAGDDLAQTQGRMEDSLNKIRKFLITKGFKEEELIPSPLRVIDRKAMEYGETRGEQMRYVIEGSVMLRSDNIELMQQVSRATSEIIRAGVSLIQENSCGAGPTYMFTKLNEIKPDMLAEATRNARKAAEQFAADSGSKVGGIKQAYQGVFSVSARDNVESSENMNSCDLASDPNKRVRVVTTVDYYLTE